VATGKVKDKKTKIKATGKKAKIISPEAGIQCKPDRLPLYPHF